MLCMTCRGPAPCHRLECGERTYAVRSLRARDGREPDRVAMTKAIREHGGLPPQSWR